MLELIKKIKYFIKKLKFIKIKKNLINQHLFKIWEKKDRILQIKYWTFSNFVLEIYKIVLEKIKILINYG